MKKQFRLKPFMQIIRPWPSAKGLFTAVSLALGLTLGFAILGVMNFGQHARAQSRSVPFFEKSNRGDKDSWTHSAKARQNDSFPWAEIPYDPSLLATTPYSKRTLQFGRVYYEMALAVRRYLGAPQVLSSYDFEPHVMADLSWYLAKMEHVSEVFASYNNNGRSIRQIIPYTQDLIELYQVTGKSGLRKAGLQLCAPDQNSSQFLQELKWLTNVDKTRERCDKAMKDLYASLASLNMYLFRHNADPESSPFFMYFKKIHANPNFNGWMEFPSDINGILKEAFHELYLAKQTADLSERKSHMEKFNLLLIGHEQILAQTYYDKMEAQQKALAGAILIKDPLGIYPLADEAWSDLQVRMSLNRRFYPEHSDIGSSPQTLTFEELLSNSNREGTIPHYYRSRLYSPDALLIMKPPKQILQAQIFELNPMPIQNPFAVIPPTTLLTQKGCLGCHSIEAVKESKLARVGPNLTHVGARRDERQIRQAIVNPPSSIMPSGYGSILKPEELDSIVHYLSQQR